MTATATLPTPQDQHELGTPAPPATETQVLSILSLVSSLAGIDFGMVVPLSIVAIVLGVLALSREPRGRAMAIAGIVIGAVPGALMILGAIFAAAFILPWGAIAILFGG